MDSIFLLDEFRQTTQGEPFRLFPFGKVVKNGRARVITPEFAKQFKLPHFKPAIKLGSHEEPTPAGGHIVGLEVREDGLYAIPEWNEKGAQAMSDGAYKYHSPEVLWEGGLEDPTTGGAIHAPLIMGDALLHTPHLGEAAALYTVETTQEKTMEENITIPKGFWEKYIAPLFDKKPETIEVVKEPEDYSVVKQELGKYKAEAETMKAQAERKVRIEKYAADLKQTKAKTDLADLLADLPEEKAEEVMREFRALSEQINASALTQETGSEQPGTQAGDPQTEFNAVVMGIVNEKGINYVAAFEQAKKSHVDLFNTAFKKKESA